MTALKRVRVEIADSSGEKMTITLEGRVSREGVQRLMDIFQLLEPASSGGQPPKPEEISKFERVLLLLRRKFPAGWFTSQDVMVTYEDFYDEPIGLSTVSTYLARLVERGEVSRSGGPATRRYRLRREDKSGEGRVVSPRGRDEYDLRGGVL